MLCVQNIIAEHEIRNISCAAQDPEDLCTFAYITKDLQSSHHYCHVFSTIDVVRQTPPSALSPSVVLSCFASALYADLQCFEREKQQTANCFFADVNWIENRQICISHYVCLIIITDMFNDPPVENYCSEILIFLGIESLFLSSCGVQSAVGRLPGV